MNRTATHPDQTTQRDAALVEEASASASYPAEQADQLSMLVAGFRLPSGPRQSTAALDAARPASAQAATAPIVPAGFSLFRGAARGCFPERPFSADETP